jgi:hypothetical protein
MGAESHYFQFWFLCDFRAKTSSFPFFIFAEGWSLFFRGDKYKDGHLSNCVIRFFTVCPATDQFRRVLYCSNEDKASAL